MVQLVFVHGVTVRDTDDDYQKNIDTRHKLFRRISLKNQPADFYEPYWGQYGATPKYDYASIPKQKAVDLALGGGITGTSNVPANAMVEAAKIDFPAVVNTLCLGLDLDNETETQLAIGLAEYLIALEGNREGPAPGPSWLQTCSSDKELYERLTTEATALNPSDAAITLGIGDALASIGRGIASGASNLVNSPIAQGLKAVTPNLAFFVGDVFKYLKEGSARDSIRDVIRDALAIASKKSIDEQQKLVVIGHSMGGVILYDMLSDSVLISELSNTLGNPFEVNLFVTIGSQPGLFEEFDLFTSSKPQLKAARPACTEIWWNIYDRIDVLSFAADGVFDGVQDFEADTLAGVGDAHSAYLKSPYVHKKLNKRMKAAGIIP